MRLRNVLQIFLIFFLWDSVFSDPERVVFGYNRAKMLTYVLGLLLIRSLVLSAKVSEIFGEVSQGGLTNYLLKPLDYFKYWIARDFAFKGINILFAFLELTVLYLILKPTFYVQTNILTIIFFLISVIFAIAILFIFYFIAGSIPFWFPEAAWAINFLFMFVIVEFLSGSLFPLDILPITLQNVLSYTPFPYLIFFPLQIYLGNIAIVEIIKGFMVAGIWLIILKILMNNLWKKGLKVYGAYGH
ncbi:hypothetical protein A2Z22_02075 [Candidatus Woesebacteria bacterium RBG_16_34_12]|uniref:ABC transporter permease n=1 Tax=Candidatus Woesebacteria bacterium RBG_16_34_12 TaxID=1802480 RepID=A0A1F7XB48_9BACT|nr:MAG: hypothetical protein A2Z22_02075 [Candidatus Woesebacteria bacterium RBG_16_34_12]